MPGSATLDDEKLVDSLVPVIDELRGELHPLFGVRAYRVFTVLQTWSGKSQGIGELSEQVTEILPQPRVQIWDGLRYVLEPCGLDTDGEIVLTEISLTYTFAELAGGDLPANRRWRIRMADAHGQGNPVRDFILTKPPYVDREKDIGWVMWLRSAGAGI